jgi:SAM-dependent methyltransferase
LLDLDTLAWLASAEGRSVLQDLAGEPLAGATRLATLARLRKTLSPPRAAAALETALLRRRAAAKFSRADAMFFTREALEQASGEEVARHRAARFAGSAVVLDLGCGAGGDTVALAAVPAIERVIAVDRDPLRLAMARLNAGAYGVAGRIRFVCADYTATPLPPADAVFLDPARRAGGRRVFSIHDYTPPLAIVRDLLARYPGGAAKISPGVDYQELAGLGLAAEVEIVSLRGECKEATLWLGGLRRVARRATILPSGVELADHDAAAPTSIAPRPLAPGPSGPAPIRPPGRYLYEPDCAIVRAHLVAHLATRFGLAQLDPEIAYLTGDAPPESLAPYAAGFAVLDAFPFSLKELNRRLRAAGVGRVVIKKRGLPIEPDHFRRQLKLAGDAERVIVLTRVQNAAYMLICSPPGFAA